MKTYMHELYAWPCNGPVCMHIRIRIKRYFVCSNCKFLKYFVCSTCKFSRYCVAVLVSRAHSFPRQSLTNSAANFVNSAAHRGKTDEIPRLTAATQLNFRGLIKS